MTGPRRIAVMGGAGAGKSTLARRMGEALDLPVIHLDRLVFGPGWAPVDQAPLRAAIAAVVETDAWVMDGTYGLASALALPRADLVIWLDQPAWRRLWRSWRKTRIHRGRLRADRPDGCEERFGWDYAVQIVQFGGWSDRLRRRLEKASAGPVMRLRGDRAVDRLVADLAGADRNDAQARALAFGTAEPFGGRRGRAMIRRCIDLIAGLWRRSVAAGVHPLVMLLSLSGVILFAHVVEEMMEGDTSASDNAILLALRVPGHLATPIGPPWLLQSAIDISALGGFTFTWLFTAAAAGFFALTRRWRTLGIFLGAIVGASVLDAVLKLSFHRARPEVVPHLTQVDNASFPSGHAMISAAIYLTLGALLASSQASRGARLYVLGLSVTVTILIGLSRLYLGVHWPSDVMAGWSLGAAWALLFWIVAAKTQAGTGEAVRLSPEERR